MHRVERPPLSRATNSGRCTYELLCERSITPTHPPAADISAVLVSGYSWECEQCLRRNLLLLDICGGRSRNVTFIFFLVEVRAGREGGREGRVGGSEAVCGVV